jgi:hypothetical protein
MSDDARFIAYCRRPSPDPVSRLQEPATVLLHDRLTGTTQALDVDQSGAQIVNHNTLQPVLSRNGRALGFLGWASDLVGGDFNNGADLFVFGMPAIHIEHVGPPRLSWPALPGRSYQLQYKNGLDDGTWQNMPGAAQLDGYWSYQTDSLPAADERYYRVLVR